MFLERLRHGLFIVVSGFGFLVESVLLSIGLIVVLAFALNGLSASALAVFINGLVDHYLSAPRRVQIEFLAGVAFAIILVTIFVSCLRAPVHLRRIKRDAKVRFDANGVAPAPPMNAPSSETDAPDDLDDAARKAGAP